MKLYLLNVYPDHGEMRSCKENIASFEELKNSGSINLISHNAFLMLT